MIKRWNREKWREKDPTSEKQVSEERGQREVV